MKKYAFVLCVALLFVSNVRADVVVDTENGTITGSGTYTDAITLTRDTTVTPDEGGITFSGAITGDYTLTKAGTNEVIMTNVACGGVNLTIDGGTVRLDKGGDAKFVFFPGKTVTVNAGGLLDLGVHDSLGYENLTANQFTININGGEVRNTAGNDSIRRVDINMTGGLLSATTGMYDILDNTVHFNILAAEGATATNPTVATISGPLDMRNTGTLLPINVAENAQLNVTGSVLYYKSIPNAGLEKSGAGTMVLSNTGNTFRGAVSVVGGTLAVLGDSLKTSSGVSVASGTTLCLGGLNAENVATSGTVGSPVASSGTIEFGVDGSTLSGALTLTGNTTINAESGVTANLSGGTSGAFTLTKTGAGVLNLSGTQSQTATVVEAGTLHFAGAGSMTGTLSLAEGVTLTKSGTGTFILPTSFATTNNDVTITGGALQFTTDQIATLGTVSVGATGEFDVNVVSDSYTLAKEFQGLDGGVGALGKSGAGTMIITDSALLPTNAKFNVHAGTLQLGTATDSVTLSSAASVDSGANFMLYVNSDTSYGQIISGAGNVVKKGDGAWTLTARQTFTGNLTVEAGSVILKGGNDEIHGTLAAASTATVKYGASLVLGGNDALCWRAGNPAMITLEGGTLTTSPGSFHNSVGKFTLQSGTITAADAGDGNNYIFDGSIKVLADVDNDGDGTNESSKISAPSISLRTNGTYVGGGFDVDEGGTLEVSSLIIGTGLTKSGLGTMVLTKSTNAYTTTTISAGTLKLEGAGKLGNGAVTVADGATLDLATTTTISNAISSAGTLKFTTNGTLSGALTLTGNTTINAESGITANLSGGTSGAFTLTKTGAGVLNLSGTQSQAATVVEAGNLYVTGAGSMTGTLSLAEGVTLTKSGTGTFILPTSFATSNNEVTITGGALQFTTDQIATLGTVSVGETGEFDVNVISDSHTLAKGFQGFDGGVGALGKSGAGTMIVTDTTLFPTDTKFNVHAGTLQLGDGETTFALNNITSIESGANVTYFVAPDETNTFTKTLTGAGTFTKTGAGKLRFEGTISQTYEPQIVVESGILEVGTARNSVRAFNHVTVKSGATLRAAAHDSLGYPVTGTMVIDLEKGTLDNASGNETLLATTLNMTGATLSSSGGGQYDILGTSVRFNVLAAEDATAENPTVTNVTSNLKLRTNTTAWPNSTAFVLDVAENALLNISGVIFEEANTAPRGFTKTGAGVLVLSGANTFTDDVLVNEGTLRLTGSVNSAVDVVVAEGATLEGSGTLGKLALAGQQHLVFTLQPDGTVTTADTIHSTGNIEIQNDVPFVVTSSTVLDWEQYAAQEPIVLMTTMGTITGDAIEKIDFGNLFGNIPDVWLEAVYHTDGTNAYYTAEVRVPEPATWLLLLLSCGALWGFRRVRHFVHDSTR